MTEVLGLIVVGLLAIRRPFDGHRPCTFERLDGFWVSFRTIAHVHNIPSLQAMAVSKRTKLPGIGYFGSARTVADRAREVAKVRAYWDAIQANTCPSYVGPQSAGGRRDRLAVVPRSQTFRISRGRPLAPLRATVPPASGSQRATVNRRDPQTIATAGTNAQPRHETEGHYSGHSWRAQFPQTRT